MSAAATALATLFYVLGYLFSLQGLLTIGIGAVLFLLLPAISLVSRFKGFARVFLTLATYPLSRLAVVVSEHNDAYLKQMSFDGLGVETITIDDETKLLSDPDNALHYWRGIRFALADEEHGVLFDPRHAAAGMRKRLFDDHDEGEFLATTDEWEQFGVAKWKPGVFAMPSVHELVDLSAVQALIDGGERAEYPERVEAMFQNSQAALGLATRSMKVLYPVFAFALTFGGIWFMAWYFGGPGAGNTDTVAYGSALGLLASLSSVADRVRAVDWRGVVAWTLLLATPVAAVGLLYWLVGGLLTLAIVTGVSLGMAFWPLLTVIVRPSAILSGALSKFWFRLGFLGYRQPVFEWTPSKYVVREWASLEGDRETSWYNLFGTIVGFTYRPEPDSWGAEPIDHGTLEAMQPALADGGTVDAATNLPTKYVRTDQLKRDDNGGFIPRRLDDSKYYLRSGLAMNRFANSATGEKSMRKLLEAKEEHGDANHGLDDSTVFKASLVAGMLGAGAGIAIFLLPAFL